jgi:hypothetical protein
VSYGAQFPGATTPSQGVVFFNATRDTNGCAQFSDLQNPNCYLVIPLLPTTHIALGGYLGGIIDVKRLILHINARTGLVRLTHPEDRAFYIAFLMPVSFFSLRVRV